MKNNNGDEFFVNERPFNDEQLGKEKEDQERKEKERLEKERLEKERLEQEKLEQERLEKERIEQERLEREKQEKERIERERLEKEWLEKERLEKERIEKWKTTNRLVDNHMLLIIPSWGELLGYPTLGKYVRKNVAKISSDYVIFYARSEVSVETEEGILHFIFGLGYYFLKFELLHEGELQSGKYITDNRLLTGLVLSDFVYDHMAISKNITLEDDRDIIIAEEVIKIPVDLSFKSKGQRTFIKGAIMRNVFIPNKDIILEFMEKIRNYDAYLINDQGHKLLTTDWANYNKILVSNKMKSFLSTGYMEPTAGLYDISYGADELLDMTISPLEQQKIIEEISEQNKVYSTLQFDPVYPYSILKNATKLLKIEGPQRVVSAEDPTLLRKESILHSAEHHIKSIINWPEQFKRNKKEDVEIKLIPKNIVVQPGVKVLDSSATIEIVEKPELEARKWEDKEGNFELRIDKSERVPYKQLPMAPVGDIEEILLYIKFVIEENHEMRSIGRAFEYARDNLRKMILQSDYMWKMSKYANMYQKKRPNMGLPQKDKEDLTREIDEWIAGIEAEKLEKERLEHERLEKERLQKERIENERQVKELLEKERAEMIKREQERVARERLEKENLEKERQRLEEDRIEQARLEEIRLEKQKIEEERQRMEQDGLEKERLETIRLEEERLERERQEENRREQELIEQERQKIEEIEQEKRDFERLKQERKGKEKQAKQQQKRMKKLEKTQQKLAKKKAREEQKLDRL